MDTRGFETYIRRRRACDSCQHRYTTLERIMDAALERACETRDHVITQLTAALAELERLRAKP